MKNADITQTAMSLPIHKHAKEIEEAVRNNRVIIIEGPTGSGKTTQLPRILLRAGFIEGVIGVTQPRRIAAVSVARRIAEEADVELGAEVGYAIRFDDRTGPKTMLKVMTDGLLLQEARTDPELSAYGLIVVDEAHERSLNIDFTLGLLHRLLKRRKDLRVVISSATLDPVMFQRFFKDVAGDVPLITVAARTHPVEMIYKPVRGTHPQEFADAIGEHVAAIHAQGDPGHILVFLSGEAMIRRAEQAIAQRVHGGGLVILPLYGRLPREDQERVFHEFPGQRKVVLSTNIAETSITIADVRHVIDSGLAKIPRCHSATGITTLAEEGVSRASAKQRAGRAGRTAPGRAIRLYRRDDLERRPEFTDEEVQRLDLSEVALRLIDLGVSDIETFPFPTPPPKKRLRAGIRALQAMGAIDGERNLTDIGKDMVAFPLSPRLARMVVEAQRSYPDVLDDVLIVGSFMSGRPPYLFPQGEETEARAAKAHFADPRGDAVTAVRVYRSWKAASNGIAFCRRNYLDPTTLKFIEKSRDQLADISTRKGGKVVGGGNPDEIVQCIAVAFADNVMIASGRRYEGPGGIELGIHPSSVVFGKNARFAVAADLVISHRPFAREVSVLNARQVAEVNPDAAMRWGLIGGAKKTRTRRRIGEEVIATPPPTALIIRSIELEVTRRKGVPVVEIPLSHARTLAGASLSGLPDGAVDLRARLVDGSHAFVERMTLGALIGLLPVIPLPEPGEVIPRLHVEGLLFEVDRHLHRLELGLDDLMAPALPHRGKRPGWVMLIANGEEGYWYEVSPNFVDAVRTSIISLRDLQEALPADDGLQERLSDLMVRLKRSAALIDQFAPTPKRKKKKR